MTRPEVHTLRLAFVAGLHAVLAASALTAADAPSADCGADLVVERLGGEHGLSHNGVHAIVQDRFGFLWIGTQGGLDRWDGVRFERYGSDGAGAPGLGSDFVTALLEDVHGRLWVGTVDGLFRLDEGRRAFAELELGGASRSVAALEGGRDGSIWVATEAAALRFTEDDARSSPWSSPKSSPGRIWDLAVDRENAAWIVVEQPEGFRVHRLEVPGADAAGAVRSFELVGGSRALAAAAAGGVWLDAETPLRLTVEQGSPVEVPGSLAEHRSLSLLEDRRGRLWSGSSRGVFVHEDGRRCRVGRRGGEPHRLWDEINTVYEDRVGTLWFGTYFGLLRHDARLNPFRHLPATPAGAAGVQPLAGRPSGEPVAAVALSPSGELWVGTHENGLLRIDPESGRQLEAHRGDANPCGDWIWDLELGAGDRLWIAGSDGLCALEPGGGTVRRVEGAPARWFSDLEEREGVLWASGGFGIGAYDVARRAFRIVAGSDQGVSVLDTIHVDADGVVWGGSGIDSGGLLVRHDPDGELAVLDAFVPEGVWDFHRDARGRLWLATGAGLRWLDESGAGLEARPPADLPSAVLYSLQEDRAGRIWAGTNRGLLRFDPENPSTTRFFDLGDGAGSLEFNRHAVARAGDELLFGGMRGVTRFEPMAIHRIEDVPTVALTEIRILGDDGERRENAFAAGPIVLRPADTALEVEFVTLAFAQPAKNRHRFRLDGYDGDWIDTGRRGFARYTGLPPGRYLLRAGGANADGVWNEVDATRVVVVRPHLWQTAWFRVLLLALVAGLVALWHRRRVARLLEMERLRLRIAADLHDDLASDLSGVALAADAVARRPTLVEADRRSLGRVRDTSLRLVDRVRDIVWATNPEHDTMEATVRRMREAARRLLVDLEWSFTVDAEARRGGIGMARRRELLLLFKEALHNVARHADASRVEITLGLLGRDLVLAVRDDGVGFEPQAERSGTGLDGMRRRCEAMGAELGVESAPGGGTTISVRIPKTRDGASPPAALQ